MVGIPLVYRWMWETLTCSRADCPHSGIQCDCPVTHSLLLFSKNVCGFHVHFTYTWGISFFAFISVELGIIVLNCSNRWLLRKDKLLFTVLVTGCFTRLAKSFRASSQLSWTANYILVNVTFLRGIYLFILLSSLRLEHGQRGPWAWKAELLGSHIDSDRHMALTSLFRHMEHLVQESSRQPASI